MTGNAVSGGAMRSRRRLLSVIGAAVCSAHISFVDRLIRLKGLPTFMALYESSDPEAEYERLYAKPLDVLAADAFE